MNQIRLSIIPRSYLFYLFIFLVCQIFILVTLCIHYHLDDIEHYYFDIQILFLDLHHQGNILDWFYSMIWMILALLGLRIFLGIPPRKEPFTQLVFWALVSFFAVLFSFDTTCSIIPFFYEAIVNFQKEHDSILVSSIVFRYIFLVLVLLGFCFLFRYIRLCHNGRFIMTICFGFCVLAFLFMFLFCSPLSPFRTTDTVPKVTEPKKTVTSEDSNNIPSGIVDPAVLGKNKSSKESTSVKDEDAPDKDNEVKDNEEKKNEEEKKNSDPKKSDQEDNFTLFRNASDEKKSEKEPDDSTIKEGSKKEPVQVNLPDDSTLAFHWEEILGWKKTLEQNIHLSYRIEEYLQMSELIETKIWENKVPDIAKLRDIVHYAGIGFFLSFLLLVVLLILRSTNIVDEERILEEVQKQGITIYRHSL